MAEESETRPFNTTGIASQLLYCRICLSNLIFIKYKPVAELFDSSQTIAQIIEDFAQIEILDNENYPQYTCLSCLEKLKVSVELKAQIRESDLKLKRVFSKINGCPEKVEPLILGLTEQQTFFKNEIEIEEPDLGAIVKMEEPGQYDSSESFSDNNETENQLSVDQNPPKNHPRKKRTRRNRNVKCPDCSEILNTPQSIREHSLLHDGLNRYRCSFCNKAFWYKYLWERHEITHKGGASYQCETCGKIFKSQPALLSHRFIHLEPRFKCDKCHKIFRRKSEFKQHKMTHSDQFLYECESCNCKFKSNKQRYDHIKRLHKPVKMSTCNVCGKSVRCLNYHLKQHTKPFQCDICNQSFGGKIILKNHKATHTNERLFACDLCEKTFKYSGSLFSHKRVHDVKKRFSCDLCGQEFNYKQNLQQHQRRYHEQQDLNGE